MRRALLAITALAMVLGASGAASMAASPTQVTDVSGDANGTDPRFAGGPAPADVQTGPASIDALDITAIELAPGQIAVRLLRPDPTLPARFVVTVATPRCGHVAIEWRTDDSSATLSGCHGRQRLLLPAGRFVGNGIVLALPATWPTWLPAGTTVTGLAAQTTADVEAVVGAVYPSGDYARGAIAGVLS